MSKKQNPASGCTGQSYCSDYLREALDYIIKETEWANSFPRQCHDRIRKVCEAVKRGDPLPFNPNASNQVEKNKGETKA